MAASALLLSGATQDWAVWGDTEAAWEQNFHRLWFCLLHVSQEEDDENLYSSIQQLRDRANELSNQVSSFEQSNSCDSRYQQRLDELRAAQERLMELTEVRNRK